MGTRDIEVKLMLVFILDLFTCGVIWVSLRFYRVVVSLYLVKSELIFSCG